MHTQINLVQDSLGWKQLESILEPAIGQCVTSNLNNFLNGRQIIFGNGERRLVPIEGWEFKNRHGNTPLMTIQPLKEETTIIAVDSSEHSNRRNRGRSPICFKEWDYNGNSRSNISTL